VRMFLVQFCSQGVPLFSSLRPMRKLTRTAAQARLFQRRSNGRSQESRHIYRVSSPPFAEEQAGDKTAECATAAKTAASAPHPWLMSHGLHSPPLAQGDRRTYAGGGVLLSILALVQIDDGQWCAWCSSGMSCRKASLPKYHTGHRGHREHDEHHEPRTTLLDAHIHLQALAEHVRRWQPDARAWASLGGEGTAPDGSAVSIELLVAATSCRGRTSNSTTCLSPAAGAGSWEEDFVEEDNDAAGLKALVDRMANSVDRVPNSLLDAASGRFVVWAVPSDVEEVGAEAWLGSILSSPQLYPPSMGDRNESKVADEWEESVLEAVAAHHAWRPDSAGGPNACSWLAVGPLLRPLALFVRFRDALRVEDAGNALDRASSADALW
jgi:hypothetical protein